MAMDFGDYDRPERNRRAEVVTQSVAVEHVGHDTAIGALGVIGSIFIPGAATAGTIAAVLKGLSFYRTLARELSEIYDTPEDRVTRRMFKGTLVADSASTVAADLVVPASQEFLVNQMDKGFLYDISSDLLGDAGLGVAVSVVPVLGGIAALGLDAAIAATMTWRVGAMVSAYYQNGGKWVGGDRKSTYYAVKPVVKGFSPATDGRANFDVIPNVVPEVFETQVAMAVKYVRETVLRFAPKVSRVDLLHHLVVEKHFPENIAKEAVSRVL